MLIKRSLNAAVAALLCLCALIAFIPISQAFAADTVAAENVTITNPNGKKSGTVSLDGLEDIASYTLYLDTWSGSYTKSKTTATILSDSYGVGWASCWLDTSNLKYATISVWGKGTHKITVRETFYNKKGKVAHRIDYSFTVKLKCTSIVVGTDTTKDNLVTYLNNTTQLSTQYTTGDVAWSSTNEAIASVDEAGLVTGHKLGRCYIKATTTSSLTKKEVELKCYVEVTYKKAYNAVNNALKDYANGTLQYSQAKRMEAGYRDCSSFVGRAYSAAGVVIGSESWVKSWSLPAADQAIWLKAKKKTIATGPVAYSKLLPGDLIFYSSSDINSIYHVAMYAGGGRIIHVSDYNPGSCVRYRYSTIPSTAKASMKSDKKIVFIGRPCK